MAAALALKLALRSAITSACATIGLGIMLEKITGLIADRNLNIDPTSMNTPFFLMACILYEMRSNVLCFGSELQLLFGIQHNKIMKKENPCFWLKPV